jgi:hypothetical protein
MNNDTDPGIYKIKILVSDDNPNTLFASYHFKLIVLPAKALDFIESIAIPQNSKIKSNPVKTSKKLQARIKTIDPQGQVTVVFNLNMREPGNITAID